MTLSANGFKYICLSCYMSWPVAGKDKTYYRRTINKPKPDAPSYVELWRENKALKERVETLDKHYRATKFENEVLSDRLRTLGRL